MIFVIPTKAGAFAWSQRQVLDGVSYVLDFAWNARGGAWYLSISDADGNPLLLSRKLASNVPLLRNARFIDGLPPGEIMALDATETIDFADYTELGPVVQLLYFDASELAS